MPAEATQSPGKAKRVYVFDGMRTVVPIQPSKLTIYPVSKLDSILGNFYLHTALYFERKSPQSSWVQEADELNYSLAKTLNLFPVVCGRLRVLENGNLGIKSNDAGARLAEASSEYTLQEWLDAKDAQLWQHVFPEIRITDYSISPLLNIQYTRFRCGGLAIGLSWCHILADFMSMDLFLKVWAEALRNSGKISGRPCFSIEKSSSVHLPEPFSGNVSIKDPEREGHVFHLSSRMVEKLMKETESEETVAVTALVWKSIVKAQCNREVSSRLCIWTSNGTKSDYFGNADTEFKFAELHTEESAIKDVAKMVKDGRKLNGSASSFFAENVIFCNWATNVPFYDTDFGFSGPVYVECSTSSVFGEGIVTVMPGREGGQSKSVFVSLRTDAMKRLLQDDWLAGLTVAATTTNSAAAA